LPDSSFLTDLTVKDSDVSIAGYSAAASSIIVALEGSDMFDQASFTGPVVKAPGNTGDRFSIDLKMGGK
jgi:general secretion pathway protein L